MQRSRPLLIRGAKQLLTLRGPQRIRRGRECEEIGVVSGASVLLKNGRVSCVGLASRVDRLTESREAEVVDAHGSVVLPAFLDPLFHMPKFPMKTLHQAALHGTAIFGVHCTLADLRSLAEVPGVVPVLTGNAPTAAEALRVLRHFPLAFSIASSKLRPWPQDVCGPESACADAAAMGTGYCDMSFSTWNVATAIGLACRSRRLSVEQALTMTTANAAHVLGLGGELGQLQVGMRADLNILAVSDYRDIPHVLGANIVARRVRAGILAP